MDEFVNPKAETVQNPVKCSCCLHTYGCQLSVHTTKPINDTNSPRSYHKGLAENIPIQILSTVLLGIGCVSKLRLCICASCQEVMREKEVRYKPLAELLHPRGSSPQLEDRERTGSPTPLFDFLTSNPKSLTEL